MIYEFPNREEPIRQGDIFYPLPDLSLNLNEIPILGEDGEVAVKNWDEVTVDDAPKPATVTLNKAWGIVASQDCDTVRAPTITFFVIEPLLKHNTTPPTNPAKWVSWITERKRERQKLFYLPKDPRIGFEDRMLVVFEKVMQIARPPLEERISTLRRGRLNEIADEHYRESIAQFFRRYPYDEWYPLDKEELSAYAEEKAPEPVRPFSWQE